uniref:ArfGAP with RhoGAP domain, ankyrin repeat and PH domain 1 n=1 Tax=Scleropages formosus TaxID=113540 RepID=A0A8C9WIN7_SCLFO
MIRDDSIYLDSEASPNIPEDSTSRPATAIKTGWLEKTPPQGSIIFQKRWITLDNEYLRYFQNDKDVYSKRMIPIYSIMRVMSVGTQKFEVVTHNRTFLFRAQSDYERNTWVSLLQKTIEEQYGVDRMTSDACGPIYIQGNLELRGIHSKLYMVVCEDKVILYKNTEEHKQGIGITSIQMNLGSVRETDKRAFDLTTPYRVFSFVAETEQMKQAWVEALQHAISSALSSDSVVAKIWSQDSNRLCADCNATHPDWASVNLCVVICSRCAGEHRRLGSSVSKVRSLKMDRNVWTEDLIKVFIMLGNERANLFWAANVPPSEALCPSSSDTDRRAFIFAKYRQGKYRWYHKLFGQQEALNKALCLNVQTDDILETLSLLFCGADVNCHTEHPEFPTPVSLATRYNQTLQVEILKQNQNTDFVDANILNDLRLSITHRGHLFKMASTTRPITERKSREGGKVFSLCTLKKGIFSYGNSRSSMPGRQLKVEEIVCLAINPPGTHGFEYTFEIYTEADRLYLFGENDPELVREWIMVIVKSILPRNARDLGRLDFQRIGRLNYKARLSQQSPGVGWFALVGSILHPRLPDHKEEEEDIDLCRLQELCEWGDAADTPLFLLRTLLIESQLKLNFLGWAQDIQQASGSWGNTLAQQQLTGTDIPIIVERCIDFITQFGLKSVGIYRKNGVSSKIANLLENFLVDARRIHLREEEHRVDDVAGTLKRFFRNVKEGVFTNQAAPAWLSTIEESQRISHYQSLLSSLPSVNKATLEALIGHLYCIQHFSNVNQMNQHNLAIVFGPTLFQTDGTDSSAGKVIEELIQHYIPIFEVNEEQLQKQLHEVNLIVEIQESFCDRNPTTSYSLLSPVSPPLQVDASMTAAALTSEVLEQHKIQPQEFDYWCSFEVNEVEETERPLHHRELMLPVLQSASTVVVKKNDAMETIAMFLSLAPLSGSTRNHSKILGVSCAARALLFSLSSSQEYISYRPEKECPIKSLTVFQGIKKKLRPPTSWGMTVVCDSEEQDRRQYMCCDTQNEMREWLAIFMSIQVTTSCL